MIDSRVLVEAYRQGIFPMALEDGEIGWFSPEKRGVLPLDDGAFHVPSRLARLVRQARFEIRIDTAFADVMHGCARRPDGTWINNEVVESYVALHRQGVAHSVEAWRDGRLAGGLYGVHLGGAFFGESMFHVVTDASKVALVALVERLRARQFVLLDTQWLTAHLAQFGGVEMPRRRYLQALGRALARPCTFADDRG